MIKIDEETLGTLSKCSPNEPIFVLRAQDLLAPTVVRIWAQIARLHDVPVAKREEALRLATDMEAWGRRKTPD